MSGEATVRVSADTVNAAYAALRDECLRRYPEQADYVNGLYESWGRLLNTHGNFWDGKRVPFWLREIASPADLDSDAALRWLDLFPELVVGSAHGS